MSKHINAQQCKNMNSLNGGKKETHITETIKYYILISMISITIIFVTDVAQK